MGRKKIYKDLDLEKKIYRVKINGHKVEFTIYGEEDDLNTLEMFISFLINSSTSDDEDDV
jgi:hypothetical protein